MDDACNSVSWAASLGLTLLHICLSSFMQGSPAFWSASLTRLSGYFNDLLLGNNFLIIQLALSIAWSLVTWLSGGHITITIKIKYTNWWQGLVPQTPTSQTPKRCGVGSHMLCL